MKKPITNKIRPCVKPEDGSSGKTRSKTAAKGIADPELIWDIIILPELGNLLERKSPIFPPKRVPKEVAIEKNVMRNADNL